MQVASGVLHHIGGRSSMDGPGSAGLVFEVIMTLNKSGWQAPPPGHAGYACSEKQPKSMTHVSVLREGQCGGPGVAGGTSRIELHMGGSVPLAKRGEGGAQEVQGMWTWQGWQGLPQAYFLALSAGTEDLSAKSAAFPQCLLRVHQGPWEERWKAA